MTTESPPSNPIAPASSSEITARALAALKSCGVELDSALEPSVTARTPITGDDLVSVPAIEAGDVDGVVRRARTAFVRWRQVPAPARGAVVKRFAELLSEHQSDLADLVTIEVGKIRSEALGEVQEMIDICDYAVGLSRQLDGRTMPSERPGHRLMETWHPLGVVGVITAFNFPVAVWSWNTAVALVCGNTVAWKPSPGTPLVSEAAAALLTRALREHEAPDDVHVLLQGGPEIGEALVENPQVALLSATGSERMGAIVGPKVAARFGRVLLELGGNNAAIVAPSADLDIAVRGIVFAAAGTAGQRCTTLRRVIAHEEIAAELTGRIVAAYESLPIGDPFLDETLVGPLISSRAAEAMVAAIDEAVSDGGELLVGGERRPVDDHPDAAYVAPAVVRMPEQSAVVRRETFAPLLYVMTYSDFDEAIELHNDVPQGLSSSIFTRDQREAERFMASSGSDCGIANVNIGTSGAEIGGAFGGEKTTGGGREAGSDAWRAYMRRATNTINYSDELPLAQGVSFT